MDSHSNPAGAGPLDGQVRPGSEALTLVERLRFLASGQDDPQSVALAEAADEIERMSKYETTIFEARTILECGHVDNVLKALSRLDRRYNDALARTANLEAADAADLRETLNFIATHFSSDWPERCQSNVLAARHALTSGPDYAQLECERLRRALHEIAEEWAGAECGEPMHAQEAYAIGLAKRMYALAAAALRPN